MENKPHAVVIGSGFGGLAAAVRLGLARRGISVRAFPDNPALEDALRITCPGDPGAFARLLDALDATLAPEAVLFDLDGVLADVSGSYRMTIEETAKSFGVELEPGAVSQMKAEGDANNDWIVTQRLLARRGVDVSLEDVTERFESIYQGTEDEPGLRRHESLIVDRSVIEAFAKKRPLALVTGRPLGDTERFLREQKIGDLFDVLVTMGDAPAKPDPAPVRLALERLGVKRAWMIGDTPDDVRAARDAGVIPFGVLAPREAPETTDVLLRAGAARVLDSLDELLENL